jgi:glycosyltransferase involved in cell wall biosynthesis
MQRESMGTMEPKVIVCMLAYNHGKYISEAIESVFGQNTDFMYKLLICNDASTDNTKDIIEKYRDIHGDKIIAVHNNKNLGIANNAKQMYGLAIDTGAEYIATLEGDDYWLATDKLQLQVDHMDNNQKVVLTCGNYTEFDDERNEFLNSNIIVVDDNKWEELDNEFVLKNWRTKYLTYLIRTSKLKETKILSYKFLVDYHLIYELKKFGTIEFYSGKLGVYRRHLNGSYGKESLLNKSKIEANIYRSILKLYPSDEFVWLKYKKTSKNVSKLESLKSRIEYRIKRLIF